MERKITERDVRAATPRFQSKIGAPDGRGCTNWTGSIFVRTGYGKISVGGVQSFLAHRLSYAIRHGAESISGLDVLHKCDNPRCVNPDHLMAGTHTDNMRDCIQKGRGNRQKGEDAHKSKLREFEVLEIRESYSSGGVSIKRLADEYGVHKSTVFEIIKRKIWRHI
jgi:transcriptional regulator with PAS, ATPase and Fis domain